MTKNAIKLILLLLFFSILGNILLYLAYNKKQSVNFYNDIRLPKFDEYLTTEKEEAFSGDFVKKVDYSSNIELTELLNEGDKMNIDAWFNKGPNFADHYVVMELGCGTMCQYLVIADAVNGKLYKPNATAQLGFSFDINSKLLIENHPWSIYEYKNTANDQHADLLSTSYYVWENNDLRLIKDIKTKIIVK